MSDTERAWAAGFFDGEGYIAASLRHNGTGKRYRRIDVQISQIDPQVLFRFQAAVGGVGSIGGPYHARSRPNPMYRFIAAGTKQISVICAAIEPFLSEIKLKQMRMAWERYELLKEGESNT